VDAVDVEGRLYVQMQRAARLARRAWPEEQDRPVEGLCKELLAHLLEEGGELAGAIRSYHGRRLRPEVSGSHKEVTLEMGDVLIVCLRIAFLQQVDPYLAIDLSLDKFERRVEALERTLAGG